MLQHLHDCFFFPYIFVFLTFTMGGYESEHEHSIEVPRHGIAIPGVFFSFWKSSMECMYPEIDRF